MVTVLTGHIYANREFFDNFENIVEDDAKWAYRFQRRFDEKLKDRDDVYLEVRDAERRRKRKGLPPRIVILPNWDMSDEDQLDGRRFAGRKRSRNKRRHVHSPFGLAVRKIALLLARGGRHPTFRWIGWALLDWPLHPPGTSTRRIEARERTETPGWRVGLYGRWSLAWRRSACSPP